MRDNLLNIVNNESCLDQDTLLAYAHGSLSSEEQHRVEKHLLDCELCSDSLDGLVAAPGEELFRSDVAELQARILNRENSNTTKRAGGFLSFYRIAAVITLVLLSSAGIYYFLSDGAKKEVLTENKIVPVTTDSGKKAEPVTQISSRETHLAREKMTPPTPIKTPVSLPEKTKNTDVAENVSADKAGSPQPDTIKVSTSISQPVPAIVNEIRAAKEEPSYSKTDNVKKESGSLDRTFETKEANMSRMKGAREQEDENLIGKQLDDAIRYFNLKDYTRAEIILKSLVSLKEHTRTDEAKWYLAKCYLATQQDEKAKTILEELVKNSEHYKHSADSLLKTIK